MRSKRVGMAPPGPGGTAIERLNRNHGSAFALFPEQKNLQGHPLRYPYGMANLTSYIHSLGLKMGIYSDAG